MGYIRESAIERMVRGARVQSIGGTTEVMLEETPSGWGEGDAASLARCARLGDRGVVT